MKKPRPQHRFLQKSQILNSCQLLEESEDQKNKQNSKTISWKWIPCPACHWSAEFRAPELCLLHSFVPKSTGAAQLPASAPGQSHATSGRQWSTACRQPAAIRCPYWHALLNQGCVLKTSSLTWSCFYFGLQAVWHWLHCSWCFHGWSYTRQTVWPEWTQAPHFNETGLKPDFNKTSAVSLHKSYLAFWELQPSI